MKEIFTQLFNTLWETMITMHPHRVFVSINMNAEDLKEEIIRRTIFKESKKIIVYSRGTKNKISEKAAKMLSYNYLSNKKVKWELVKKKYKIGNNPAMKLEVIPHIEETNEKKKQIRTIPPQRLLSSQQPRGSQVSLSLAALLYLEHF
jgi:hypothetical protein